METFECSLEHIHSEQADIQGKRIPPSEGGPSFELDRRMRDDRKLPLSSEQ